MEVELNIIDAQTATNCGQVKLLSFGGKYDVCFVALNSNATCSNTISGYSRPLMTSNYEIDHPIVGKVIYHFGYASGQQSGTIVSSNYSFYDDKTYFISFTNMGKSTCIVSSGDSGGLVASSAPDGYHMVQEGIIAGNVLNRQDEPIASYYCTAANIVNLWYLSAY